ncbi:MAG: hypothetical protein JSW61_13915 [Candidatus Thorarchaeota archaeon]|nr:MAG: hypothetical protein JSW61_13915 [Candidatus Thorarchaeota archaeon]
MEIDREELWRHFVPGLRTRETQVLQAILEIHQKHARAATFEEIRDALTVLLGRKPSRVWVYKCINGIRDAGFLEVIPHPTSNRYLANEEIISRAIRQKREAVVSDFEARKAELQEQIGFLENLDSYALAVRTLRALTEGRGDTSAKIVEGINNVRQTIIDEILEVAKPGDVVRIHQDIEPLSTLRGPMGPVEMKLIEIATEGVDVRGFMTGGQLKENEFGALASFFSKAASNLIEAAVGGNLHFRMKPDLSATYRIVALNRERMILIMSEGAHPDTVIFMTRESNPRLIDDAVNVFDSLWGESIDLLARLGDMVADLKTSH